MTRKQALIELRDKVKSGADDLDIIEALHHADVMLGQAGRYVYVIDAYRGSLDAAKALHEAVLPGRSHQWHISNEVNFDGYVCSIFSCAADSYVSTTHQPTPARAWLLAILEALIAQEPDT
jgi:hypothetical protein